jgi:forkhead protein FKH
MGISSDYLSDFRTVLEIGGIQMMFVLPTPLPRSSLLLIHARQHNLPLPFQTPSPTKRTTVLRSLSPTVSYPQGVRIVQGPRIITSPNGTEYSQQGEIDLSLESSREIKPQFSYAMMIAEAILSVPERKMQLSKIYDFIMSRYAFYRYTKSGWQVPTSYFRQLTIEFHPSQLISQQSIRQSPPSNR